MQNNKKNPTATKARIVKSAIELFSKRGYSETSMDDIAKKSKINKAMIYYYFKSKANLYEEVMGKVLKELYISIKEAEKCCESPLGDLEIFIKKYAYFSKKYPYLPTLILRELSFGGKYLPNMVFAGLRDIFSLLNSILKEGEKEGIFKDVKPMVVHFMITGTINLLSVTKELRESAKESDPSLDTCIDEDLEEISKYIFKKVKFMLEVDDEEDICRS